MCLWPQDLWCFCEFKSPQMHSQRVSLPPRLSRLIAYLKRAMLWRLALPRLTPPHSIVSYRAVHFDRVCKPNDSMISHLMENVSQTKTFLIIIKQNCNSNECFQLLLFYFIINIIFWWKSRDFQCNRGEVVMGMFLLLFPLFSLTKSSIHHNLKNDWNYKIITVSSLNAVALTRHVPLWYEVRFVFDRLCKAQEKVETMPAAQFLSCLIVIPDLILLKPTCPSIYWGT